MEEQILALRSEGLSIREIARELGVNRGKVHRVVSASPVTAAPAGGSVVVGGGDDPVLALLTPADLTWLGVTAAEVAAGRLGALRRYRCLALPSAAGAAARSLFDHGRGSERFSAWCHADPDEEVPVPGEGLAPHVRDRRIMELRREGWTLRDIGEAVQMSESGVSQALTRIETEGPRDEDWGVHGFRVSSPYPLSSGPAQVGRRRGCSECLRAAPSHAPS